MKEMDRGRVAADGSVSEPVRKFVFQSPVVKIGTFGLDVSSPFYRNTGPVQRHVVVFPRFANWIQPDGKLPAVADRRTILTFNQGDFYRRESISGEGDYADCYSPSPELLDQMFRTFGLASGDERRPFSENFTFCDSGTYFLHDRIFGHASRGELDPLFVEEATIELLQRVFGFYGHVPHDPGGRRKRDLAEATRSELARTYSENLTLEEIARRVGVSMFHLCRIFREVTGISIHRYRDEVRQRAALERLSEPGIDLTALALDLGYSSHSHFTGTFRRHYGTTPSLVRRENPEEEIRRLLKRSVRN